MDCPNMINNGVNINNDSVALIVMGKFKAAIYNLTDEALKLTM
jgi:hypothetical protein